MKFPKSATATQYEVWVLYPRSGWILIRLPMKSLKTARDLVKTFGPRKSRIVEVTRKVLETGRDGK